MQNKTAPNLVFESSCLWSDANSSDVLVIHCSAPEYQAHFSDFCQNGLAGKSFSRIAVPGGPQFLVTATFSPKFGWAGRRWTRFLVESKGAKEIVCIAHEDCGWYRSIMFGPVKIDAMKKKQVDDLKKIKFALLDTFNDMPVKLIYAAPNSEGRVEFSEIN